jgi:hypothetical protein
MTMQISAATFSEAGLVNSTCEPVACFRKFDLATTKSKTAHMLFALPSCAQGEMAMKRAEQGSPSADRGQRGLQRER